MNDCLFLFVFAVLDRSLVASCKDSIGWMFSKLDTNSDLYLDQAELAAINLDKYEVCIRPFFNSCDSYRDGKVSTAEWCLCFWRESEYSGEGVSLVGCVRVHRHTHKTNIHSFLCVGIFPIGACIQTSRLSAALRFSHLCCVLVRHYLSSYSSSCSLMG